MFLILLLFVAALSLEGIGTYTSVIGLAATFASDPVILILAVVLDFCKIIGVNTLAKSWSKLGKAIKTYMIASTLVLSIITSAGVAGYMSNSFQKAMLPHQGNDIALVNLKSEQDRLNTRKIDIDKQISQLPANNVKGRQRLMASFKKETDHLNSRLIEIDTQMPALQTSQVKINSDVGSIMYFAEVAKITPTQAVAVVIGLIIFVFDPMAIIFLITANRLLSVRKEEKPEAKKQTIIDMDKVIVIPDEPKIEEPIPEPMLTIQPEVKEPAVDELIGVTPEPKQEVILEPFMEIQPHVAPDVSVAIEAPQKELTPDPANWPFAPTPIEPTLELLPIDEIEEPEELKVEPLMLEYNGVEEIETPIEPIQINETIPLLGYVEEATNIKVNENALDDSPVAIEDEVQIHADVKPQELNAITIEEGFNIVKEALQPARDAYKEKILNEPALEDILKDILKDDTGTMTQEERVRLDKALDRIFAIETISVPPVAVEEPKIEAAIEIMPEKIEAIQEAPDVIEEVKPQSFEHDIQSYTMLDDPALDHIQGSKVKHIGTHWINPKLLEIYSKK
jgi:hypothetical protein